MVQFLIIQIKLGNITVEQIPEKYQEAVRSILNI